MTKKPPTPIQEIVDKIHEYAETTSDYYKQSEQLEQQIREYLDNTPDKVTVYDEYIQVNIPEPDLTNVVVEKLETLVYYTTPDHRMLIPIPSPRGGVECKQDST